MGTSGALQRRECGGCDSLSLFASTEKHLFSFRRRGVRRLYKRVCTPPHRDARAGEAPVRRARDELIWLSLATFELDHLSLQRMETFSGLH